MNNLHSWWKKLLVSFVLIIVCKTSFAGDPYITENSEIHFGYLIYIPGGCVMAYDTLVLTNNTSAEICTSDKGQAGKYRIYADPGKSISVKVKSHNDDGIIYVPAGQAVSDTESILLVSDIGIVINSGVSGIIDITLGGRIQVNTILISNKNYDENFDIEFSEQ